MYTEQPVEKLLSFMDSRPVAGELTVDIAERDATKHSPEREARTAVVEVKFGTFKMNPPKRLSSNSPDIEMSAVYLLERDAPEGAVPVEWMLLTDIEVDSFEQACEKVHWYQMRWRIEMFFKTLKSGFRVEKCRLDDADKLIRYLTVMSIVAWRLFALTFIARCNPDTNCSSFLAEKEWKVLFLKANKDKKIPLHPPNMQSVVLWIAKLGGFLGRKNDGAPGTLVLWRSWKKLQDIIEGVNLRGFAMTCG